MTLCDAACGGQTCYSSVMVLPQIDIHAFQSLAESAMQSLPTKFQNMIENVVVCVEDHADGETLADMNMHASDDLLGLYQGWPLSERGVSYGGQLPDMIHLYRRPILSYCEETGEDVAHCIRHVLIHELGHYFGFSDAEMEEIECRV